MKFKNLITETIIDTLKLSKEEKGILKTFNVVDDDKHTYESRTLDLNDGEKLIKVSDMTGVNDLDKIYSLYKFFKKYKDILFKDEMGGIKYGVLDINDNDLISSLILKYFYDHYNETTLVKVPGGEWRVITMFGLQDQIAEETYSIIIYLDSDTLPNVVMYCGIFKDNDKGIGWDLLTHDDDFAIFNGHSIKHKGKFDEVLDTGHINIPAPKNLSNSEMEKYFKQLFTKIEDIILEDMWVIEEYMEYKNNN